MKKDPFLRILSDRETPRPLKSLLAQAKYFFIGKLPFCRKFTNIF